jgi:flagellin-like hook-associated protein FlgL
MSVSSIGSNSALVVQTLVEMRQRLDDLQRQLGTGKRSDTYAGIGIDRGLTVGLRAHLGAIDGFRSTITNIGVRLNLAQSALSRISEIGHDVKAAVVQSSFDVDASGQTSTQKLASTQLNEMLGLLNTQAGDRYLFSGLAGDKPAVETPDHILEGDGARAGFKQIIAERNQADLGADGLGRLVITAPTADSVSLAEDVTGSPFGFKLAAATSTLTNAVVAGPAGAPPAISVDFSGGNPNAGETIQFRFTLPDGTSESITLTATASATPGPNEFTIGATTAATAANMQAALTGAVDKLAKTSLQAASSIAASTDFFAIDDANPPRRVAGPPFDTATAFTAGTAADTVFWYIGEAGSDPARSTAVARVDDSITVSYGLRANEQGIRWIVQNVAVLAAVTFSQSDPNGEERNAALTQRLVPALAVPAGVQKIENIQADLAGAQTTIVATKDRHAQTTNTLSDLLQQIEGVSTEEVAAQILALQTRLQASLQTTALLYQTSLVNFL